MLMARSFFKRLVRDKRGNVLIITAVVLPVLTGFVGLGTDTIQWTLWKRQIQRGADSSAIAGVYQRIQDANTLNDVKTAVNKDLDVNKNDVGAFVATYPKVELPADSAAGTNQVSVELAVTKNLSFSSLFLNAAPVIKSKAVAAIVPGGEYCIVALEKTATTGILGSGNGTVNLDCGMITNSTSLDAAIAKGSSTLNTTVVAAVGGIKESSNWSGATYLPFSLPIVDPFASVPATIPAGTPSRGNFSDKPGDFTTINPGVYTNFSAKGDVTLNPGTYFLDGTNLDLGSQANVHGTGVTFVMTNSNASSTAKVGNIEMNAGSVLNISSPSGATDVYKGIVIYQDRRASALDSSKINGHSNTKINGSIYLPNQEVTINGSGSMDVECMLLVVKRVVFTGSSTMTMKKNCSSTGGSPFKGRAIRLIS